MIITPRSGPAGSRTVKIGSPPNGITLLAFHYRTSAGPASAVSCGGPARLRPGDPTSGALRESGRFQPVRACVPRRKMARLPLSDARRFPAAPAKVRQRPARRRRPGASSQLPLRFHAYPVGRALRGHAHRLPDSNDLPGVVKFGFPAAVRAIACTGRPGSCCCCGCCCGRRCGPRAREATSLPRPAPAVRQRPGRLRPGEPFARFADGGRIQPVRACAAKMARLQGAPFLTAPAEERRPASRVAVVGVVGHDAGRPAARSLPRPEDGPVRDRRRTGPGRPAARAKGCRRTGARAFRTAAPSLPRPPGAARRRRRRAAPERPLSGP